MAEVTAPCTPLTRGIRLCLSTNVQASVLWWCNYGTRMRIDVSETHESMPRHVFLYRRLPPDPFTGDVLDEFCGIASFVDINRFPVGDPDPDLTDEPFLRLDYVELDVRSWDRAVDIWLLVQDQVKVLIEQMKRADCLTEQEVTWCGDEPLIASASSSSASASASQSASASASQSESVSTSESMSESESMSASVGPSNDHFASCQQTPTNDPTSGNGGVLTEGCGEIPTVFDSAHAFSDEGTYFSWRWTGTFFFLDWILEVRCDKSTGEVAAAAIADATVPSVGGSDSIWPGFQVVTGLVSCVGGNLSGTFTLSSADIGAGLGSCLEGIGEVDITL